MLFPVEGYARKYELNGYGPKVKTCTVQVKRISKLKENKAEDSFTIFEGVIPQQDYEFLCKAGVSKILALEPYKRCSARNNSSGFRKP